MRVTRTVFLSAIGVLCFGEFSVGQVFSSRTVGSGTVFIPPYNSVGLVETRVGRGFYRGSAAVARDSRLLYSCAHLVYDYRKGWASTFAFKRAHYRHGEVINRKRVARIRRQRGLMASRGHGGKRRRVRPGLALRRSASRPDEVWSYDFIQDSTADGGTVRILSIIDEYTRECLLLRAARSFPSRRVIDALEEVMVCSGRKPQYIRSDNGPEFVAKSVQKWLGQAQVGPRYIEPGAPWENAYVESFHAQVRLELLDRELFFNLREVNAATSNYAYEYNFQRPHGSLGKRPPAIAAQRELPLRPTACAPVRAGNVPMNN
jgi:putative transposase